MKHFIILFLSSFLWFGSYGQFEGGIKGGANICNFIVSKSGDLFAEESFTTKVSWHVGTYVQQSFSDHLAWQIEVLFSNKGYIHEIENQSNNISLNYLNWPILFVYKPIKLLEFEVGPELGYLISGEDFLSNFDMAIDLGARFNISEKFNAGLRFSQGLPFKMKLSSAEAEGYEPTYQNSIFQVYMGFNLVKEQKEDQ